MDTLPTDRRCDVWYDKQAERQKPLRALRNILLAGGLIEAFKWRHPIYTWKTKNVAAIESYRSGFGVSFFKGALLTDKSGLLVSPGPNSHHARRVIFREFEQIAEHVAVLEDLIAQAIQLEKDGRTVTTKPTTLPYPEELAAALDADPDLASAWAALTPGRKRGWLLHFSSAKQSLTRQNRISKAQEKIGLGLGPQGR